MSGYASALGAEGGQSSEDVKMKGYKEQFNLSSVRLKSFLTKRAGVFG